MYSFNDANLYCRSINEVKAKRMHRVYKDRD